MSNLDAKVEIYNSRNYQDIIVEIISKAKDLWIYNSRNYQDIIVYDSKINRRTIIYNSRNYQDIIVNILLNLANPADLQ